MIKNNPEKFIGKIYNKIKVLSYSHSVKIGKNTRNYYNVECLNCNQNSIVREDRFSNKVKNSSCKYCSQNLAIKNIKAKSETVFKNLYTRYKYNAKIRNYIFNIDYDVFKKLVIENCHYCNSEPVETLKSKNINKSNEVIKHNGLDRVDNEKGYVELNVVPCCGICNIMKRNLGYEDFLSHIFKINKHSNTEFIE